jgi:hypothetical protein
MIFYIMPSSTPRLGSPSGSPETKNIVFTDKSIKYLGASEKRRVVWAKGLKGLGIRITPSGTKPFVYNYDVEGQDRWLTLGQYPKLKLAGALRKYGELLGKSKRERTRRRKASARMRQAGRR